MIENLNQSDGVNDAISGALLASAEDVQTAEQSGRELEGTASGSGGGGENSEESSGGAGNAASGEGVGEGVGDGGAGDNTGDNSGDVGNGDGNGEGDNGISAPSATRPLLQNVMSLCVSMIEGAVKEEDFAALMDAIVAREKILELEHQLETERADHSEELERLKEEAAEELGRKTAEAYAAGEIAGRNARIEESLRAVPVVPALGGTPAAAPRHLSSIFDLAASAR